MSLGRLTGRAADLSVAANSSFQPGVLFASMERRGGSRPRLHPRLGKGFGVAKRVLIKQAGGFCKILG
jgi:hypothetical protein